MSHLPRLLGFIIVAAVIGTASAGSEPSLVLAGATVLDGNGGPPLHNGTIVIEHGHFVAVGENAAVRRPKDARVIDVSGKYIIPGLMDANVHLDFGLTPEYLFGFENRFEELILEGAQVALRSGVTTVFDTWGPRAPLVKVRDAINANEMQGSRMFVAGNIIGMGGPTSGDFFPQIRGVISAKEAARIDAIWEQGVGPDLLWRTPSQVRKAVRDYIASGSVDFVKYLGSGHTQMQFIAFSSDAQRAIVEEAHRAGFTVQAHTTSPESLRMEMDAGADLLQHCDVSGLEPIPEETIQLIVARRLPCAALIFTERYLAWSDQHAPEIMKPITRVKDENDRRLIGAGAVLLLTTDAGLLGPKAVDNPLIGGPIGDAPDSPTKLGEAHVLWLRAAIERGMSPMDALLAATRNIARAYHKADELGTIERGKRADLVILDANPLENPDHYKRVVDVYKDGVRVDRSALPTRHIMTAP